MCCKLFIVGVVYCKIVVIGNNFFVELDDKVVFKSKYFYNV